MVCEVAGTSFQKQSNIVGHTYESPLVESDQPERGLLGYEQGPIGTTVIGLSGLER